MESLPTGIIFYWLMWIPNMKFSVKINVKAKVDIYTFVIFYKAEFNGKALCVSLLCMVLVDDILYKQL